jgi:hypothetical protein
VGTLIQSYSMIATALFAVVSATVGVRMLLLSRRTGCKPELLLGCGVLGTAVFGYGVLIAASVVRGPGNNLDTTTTQLVLQGAGVVLHDLGVTCFVLFVLTTFRAGERWALALASLLIGSIWIGDIGWESLNRFRDAGIGNAFWWMRYGVIWTYPLWAMIESYRYYVLMRRRLALGLVDPLVANRFFLWGTGSLGTLLAIWTSSIPFMLVNDVRTALAAMPLIQVVTATFGVVTVVVYYLTFFPPTAYKRWVAGAPATA